jgi:dUTP pyrophosphatase
MQIALVAIHPAAHLPERMTPGSVGYDLRAVEPVMIARDEVVLIPTGLALAHPLPDHVELQIRPRSSLFKRTGLLIPNSPGTVDSDYDGQLCVQVWRPWRPNADPYITIQAGDRIAQLLVKAVLPVDAGFQWAAEQHGFTTIRGGFGSTGA